MKAVLTSISDIPEALRTEYEERAGKYFLKVEGDYQPLLDANTKLAEFRDNNRALNTLKTELEGKLDKFKDIDPTEYGKMKDKIIELEKKGIKGGDDVAEQIKAAVKAAVEPIQTELAARKTSEEAAKLEAANANLEGKLREAGIAVGIDERALPDYVNRGKDVFKIVNGQPVARKGDAPIFSKDKPTEELSMVEWATSLQTDAPFLFKPSRGGGGGGNGGPGGPIVKKTIAADPLEFGRNLEGIAKGEVVVQQ